MSNIFSMGFNASANGNIGSVTAEFPTGAKLVPVDSSAPDTFIVYPSNGGIATAGPNTGGLCLADVDHTSDDQSITIEINPFGAYNPGGEGSFAYGDAGAVARARYVGDYGTVKFYDRYRAYFRDQNNTLHVDRINVNTATPGLLGDDVTSLFSAALATPIVTGTNRFLTLEVSGTNPVLIDVKENGVSLLPAPIQDSSAGRITTGKKFGAYMRAPNGNPLAIASLSADTLTVAATVPGVPTIGAASVTGATSASINGTAPASNGGATIDLYRATLSPSGAVFTSATLPVPATGLTTGSAQTARLEAHNSVGWSGMSAASNSFTPSAGNQAPTFGGTIGTINGTVGVPITPVDVSSLFTDAGDTKAFSASVGGTAWPNGITINASTGIISGTPTAAATTSSAKVRDTDSGSLFVDSNAFNFVIAAAPTGGNFAASGTLKNLNGSVLPDGIYSVILRSLTNLSAAPAAVKTGLALTSGIIGALTNVAGTGPGTTYVYEAVNEADTTIRGLARGVAT